MSDLDETPVEKPKWLEVDLSVYAPLFEDDDVSEADKKALLEALWSIIVSCAQIGWRVHPVQQARGARATGDSCGKSACSDGDAASPSAFMVGLSNPNLMEHFSAVAARPPQKEKES